MVTKTPSNVIQLKASRSSLYVNINNNTAKKFKARQKDFYLRDNNLKGFYIRVRPNGKKSYAVEAKRFGNGRKQSYTIGDINLFSAKQAREIAIDNLQQIKSGKSLSAEKNKQATQDKNIQTLESLIPKYIGIRDLADRTRQDYQYRIPQQMPTLIKKNIRELSADDLEAWWIKAKAKGSREVCLRYVSALLNYAIAKQYVTENVAEHFRKGILGGIKQRPPKTRHISLKNIENWAYELVKLSHPHIKFRINTAQDSQGYEISDEDYDAVFDEGKEVQELEKLWIKQKGEWQDAANFNFGYWNKKPMITAAQRDYILFLLITGKRKKESADLTWKDINFKEYTITLHKTKSGKVDVIPMTNLMWHMMTCRNESPYKHPQLVFPNKYNSGPINNIRVSLGKICHVAEMDFISDHDLRRTFATMSSECGLSKTDTAILLNHSMRDVTEGYIQRTLKNKRDNIEKIEQLMLGHLHGWMKVYWYDGDERWCSDPSPDIKEENYYY